MRQVITLEDADINSLSSQIKTHLDSGWTLSGSSFLREQLCDGTFSLRFCQCLEKRAEGFLASFNHSWPWNNSPYSDSSKRIVKNRIEAIASASRGWFTSDQMIQAVAASLGYVALQPKFRQFVQQTLSNMVGRRELESESRISHNLFRCKRS